MSTEMQLRADLLEWWRTESEDWDDLVAGSQEPEADAFENLWRRLPVVDSKAVARTSPIFKRHLGIPLRLRLIRPGGYDSFEAVLSDIVPKMVELARSTREGEVING